MDRRGDNKRGRGIFQGEERRNKHWADEYIEYFLPKKKRFYGAIENDFWTIGFKEGVRIVLENLDEIVKQLNNDDNPFNNSDISNHRNA